jgi:branched-chain amino acid transport system permease protein
MTEYHTNFFLALLFAIIINVLINATITTWLASRLRNLLYTLATIALQLIFLGVVNNWQNVTQGHNGIYGIPKPTIGTFEFSTEITFCVLTAFFTIVTLTFFWLFPKTQLCRMLECTRDDEVWMTVLGKNPIKFKLFSISLSVAFATIAGGLYATYMSYIDPTSFTMDESILILTIILVGGTGNIIGPVSGAVIYVLLPELLRFLSLPDAIAANARMIIYAMVLISILRLKPNGLFGKFVIKG